MTFLTMIPSFLGDFMMLPMALIVYTLILGIGAKAAGYSFQDIHLRDIWVILLGVTLYVSIIVSISSMNDLDLIQNTPWVYPLALGSFFILGLGIGGPTLTHRLNAATGFLLGCVLVWMAALVLSGLGLTGGSWMWLEAILFMPLLFLPGWLGFVCRRA